MLSLQCAASTERLNPLTPPRIDPDSKERGNPFDFSMAISPDFIQYHFSLEFSPSLPKTSMETLRDFHLVFLLRRIAILFQAKAERKELKGKARYGILN